MRTLGDVKHEALARLLGVYGFDDGSIYVVRQHSGSVEGFEPGQAAVALFASSGHELFARALDVVVSFAGADGAATAMTLRTRETERGAARASEAKSRQVLSWLVSTERRFEEQT